MAAIVSESNVYSQSRRGGKSPASRNELQGGLSGRGQAFVDIKIRVAWEFIHGRKTVNKLFRKHMVHPVHGRPRRVPGAWGKYASRRERARWAQRISHISFLSASLSVLESQLSIARLSLLKAIRCCFAHALCTKNSLLLHFQFMCQGRGILSFVLQCQIRIVICCDKGLLYSEMCAFIV